MFDNKYSKTKVKSYKGRITSNFNSEMPKEGSNCIYLSYWFCFQIREKVLSTDNFRRLKIQNYRKREKNIHQRSFGRLFWWWLWRRRFWRKFWVIYNDTLIVLCKKCHFIRLVIYKISSQEMCQDYHKNLGLSLYLLNFFGFLVCFMSFVSHTIDTSLSI